MPWKINQTPQDEIEIKKIMDRYDFKTASKAILFLIHNHLKVVEQRDALQIELQGKKRELSNLCHHLVEVKKNEKAISEILKKHEP